MYQILKLKFIINFCFQEGPRYNALHIAAKSKNLEIVKLILDSVTNVDFISHLYDDNDINSCKERIEILLDMYLNMPDKGLNETPLHIAVKHGAVDIVEYLTSYPQCQRNLVNKFHQRPKDVSHILILALKFTIQIT